MNYFNKNSIWAIIPELITEVKADVEKLVINTDTPTTEKSAAIMNNSTTAKQDKIVVLPLSGTIVQKEGIITKYLGGTSTETFGSWVDYFANDDSVNKIIIDVNSGGGSVYGVKELSDKIFAARQKKQIVSVVNSVCCSAAYWIASAADKIYITPSGETGSIGVLCIHQDFSKYEENAGIKTTIIKAGKNKVEGNPYEPLTDEARENLQKSIDDFYNMFVSDVAKNRGTTKSNVLSSYGQGRVLMAKDALQVGMVDGIKTLEEVLNLKQIRKNNNSKAKAELELRKLK